MRILILVALFMLLSGCNSGTEKEVGSEPKHSIKSGKTGGTIEMIELEDGTRCVTYYGYKSGGIDCDWKSADKLPGHNQD